MNFMNRDDIEDKIALLTTVLLCVVFIVYAVVQITHIYHSTDSAILVGVTVGFACTLFAPVAWLSMIVGHSLSWAVSGWLNKRH